MEINGTMHEFYHVRERFTTQRDSAANGNDDDGSWYNNYIPDSSEFSNHASITTSVTIHVSPDSFSFLSWVLLWFGFIIAICLATSQVYKEHHWMTAQIRRILSNNPDLEGQHQGNGNSGGGSSSNSGTYRQQQHRQSTTYQQHSTGASQYHHHARGGGYVSRYVSPGHRRTNSGGNHSTSGSSGGGGGGGGDGEIISSADMSRNLFRKLLWVALTSRAVLMPVQVWSNPFWSQLIADSLPRMTFASAWTLLMSFFVQLVGVASGSYPTNGVAAVAVTASSSSQSSSPPGSSPSSTFNGAGICAFNGFFGFGASSLATTPGIVVMQWTAYATYAMLVATYLFSKTVASAVLLYALICCIYAALLGTSLYFGPRLCMLLQPTLARHHGLAIRLVASTCLCIFVFGAETFGMARRVVAPPSGGVSWWWQYGVLELIPATLCLIMMHTSRDRGGMADSAMNNNNEGNHAENEGDGGGTLISGSKPGGMAVAGGGTYRRTESHGSVNRAGSARSSSNAGVVSGSGSEAVPLLKSTIAYGAASSPVTASGGTESNTNSGILSS